MSRSTAAVSLGLLLLLAACGGGGGGGGGGEEPPPPASATQVVVEVEDREDLDEICERLRMTAHVVATHVRSAYTKLQLNQCPALRPSN